MPRPKKSIDERLLYKLAYIHLPDRFIADCLGCSIWTLERRYAKLIEKAKSEGKAKLLSKAWTLAEEGEWPAIKYLLGNFLKMSDRVDQEDDDQPKPIVLSYSKESLMRTVKNEVDEPQEV